MRYISLFSGIGGLESSSQTPLAVCEIDPWCQKVLSRKFPEAELSKDVRSFIPPAVDVVVGGWPCQDISAAGLRKGLAGERSGLFFRMLDVAIEAGAHTIVAENVPNLLRLEGGRAFRLIVTALQQAGFTYVAWRTLNAREFALPQNRNRVFLIASRFRELSSSVHRPVNVGAVISSAGASGFYWTAGLQGICYSDGCVPALKVGSSIGVPSPPAIHYGDMVRKASANECLAFQGFSVEGFLDIPDKAKFAMAGNAVALPVGRFVMDGVFKGSTPDFTFTDLFSSAAIPRDGIDFGEGPFSVANRKSEMSSNLAEFIDRSITQPLSRRAAGGLLSRLERSGKPCPSALLEQLRYLSALGETADSSYGSEALFRSSTV